MNSKRKLIISILVVSFVLLSIVATVAVVFALTQQTIKTSLNIGYTVEDIDGTASATYTIGGVTESLVAMKGESVIGDTLVFRAGDTENAGNLMFPEDALALTAQNDNVVIQYTYSNTGAKHYIASMDFNANITANNMKVEYSIDGVSYSENRYAVVVPANTSNRSYWIKISIDNKAASASFTGDFDWLLSACDPQEASYLSMPKLEFIGSNGSYSANIASNGGYVGNLVFPSEVNGDPVTTIVANPSLTQAQKAQVINVYIPNSVTTIGESAFEGYTNLQTVTFEQNESVSATASASTGLTTISANAFKNCSKLNNFVIPSTVTSFNSTALTGCSSLKNITADTSSAFSAIKSLATTYTGINLTVGNSVTRIGYSAFENCTGLTSITIPNSVTSIGEGAFWGCTSLTSIEIPNTVTAIEGSAFRNCTSLVQINIPAKVTSIVGYAFSGCTSLQTVSIAENSKLKIIETHSFNSCSSLRSLNVPQTVTEIGAYAFVYCSMLSEINIPANLYRFDNGVFKNCKALESIDIPAKVKEIPYEMFVGCYKLKTVNIAEGSILTTIGGQAFNTCSVLESIVIPEGVTTIGETAFAYCRKLKTVEFKGNNITKISNNTFEGCSALESVNIPSSVTLIQRYAFMGCSSLGSIEIPSKVDKIEYAAFRDCINLKTVTFAQDSVLTTLASEVFSATGITEITLPATFTTGSGYEFAKCSSLEKVRFAEGTALKTIPQYMFNECGSLKDVIIPDTVTTIGKGAFRSCSKLPYIVIPASVTAIGSSAFYDCWRLNTVVNLSNVVMIHGYKSASVAEYADMVFKNEVVWTESTVDGIKYRTYTAKYDDEVKFITKDNAEVQSQSSFKVLVNVADKTKSTYTLADDIDAIGYNVFAENENLTHITLPANLKSIGFYAFRYCYNLAVICNLSELPLTDLSHESSQYGYMTWYLGELYKTPIDVVEQTINNVKYLDVYNSTDTEHATLIDRIACGYEPGISADLVLDEHATVVSYKAFEEAGITSVTLPAGFRKIQYKAFDSGVAVKLNNVFGWQLWKSGAWSDYIADPETTISSNLGYVYRNIPGVTTVTK